MFYLQAAVQSRSHLPLRGNQSYLNHKELKVRCLHSSWKRNLEAHQKSALTNSIWRKDRCSKGELMLSCIHTLTRSVSDDQHIFQTHWVPTPSQPKRPNNDPLEQRMMMQKFHIFTNWISICQHTEEGPISLTTADMQVGIVFVELAFFFFF